MDFSAAGRRGPSIASTAGRFPGGLRGEKEIFHGVLWDLSGLAGTLALKTIWELLRSWMRQQQSPREQEELSADAPCRNSSAGHRVAFPPQSCLFAFSLS